MRDKMVGQEPGPGNRVIEIQEFQKKLGKNGKCELGGENQGGERGHETKPGEVMDGDA